MSYKWYYFLSLQFYLVHWKKFCMETSTFESRIVIVRNWRIATSISTRIACHSFRNICRNVPFYDEFKINSTCRFGHRICWLYQTGNSTAIKRTAVREPHASWDHMDTPKTPWTSRHYGIAGFKGGSKYTTGHDSSVRPMARVAHTENSISNLVKWDQISIVITISRYI